MRFLIIFIFFISNVLADEKSNIKNLIVNKELKTYDNITFLDTKDKLIKLNDYKGYLVILNFWATWCVPCIKEMPELNKAYASYKDSGVEIIAINFAESRSEVDEFVNKHQLNFPVVLDKYGDVSQDYKIRNLPVTYFISSKGIIMDIAFGGINQEFIKAKLKQLDQAIIK